MMRITTILCILFSMHVASAQDSLMRMEDRPNDHLRIGFWNQENLFDIYDDSLTNDESYTPEGDKGWTEGRYYAKLMNMSKAIAAIGGWNPIDVLGLCEVENKMVVRELVERTPLRSIGYEVVHYQSPDSRGIDVALIYRPDRFTLLHSEPVKVWFTEEGSRPTRDVLYVKGLALGKDTVHIFVNHWPSRWGGQAATEPKRMRAAEIVKAKVDSIFSVVPNAPVIITGDFNDEPEDRSMLEVLQAGHDRENLKDNTLFNLMFEKVGKEGSHKYQGHWGILDQIVVTSSMLRADGNGLKVSGLQAHIFKAPFLLTEDARYTGHQLLRTHSGPRYLGGFSDHLPVFIDLEIPRSPVAEE